MRRIRVDFSNRQRLSASLRRVISGGNNARAQGDAARDRKAWTEAESQYRRHLASSPKDAAIWVQLGHALKESGQREEAETAYQTALELTPNDADLHLQIGHLMRLTGRVSQAAESYAISANLLPTEKVYGELAALKLDGNKGTSFNGQQQAVSHVYLPINDLLHYLNHHRTVSGIQRVQLNLIPIIQGLSSEYRFVHTVRNKVWAISPGRMTELVSWLEEGVYDVNTVKSLIETAKSQSERVAIQAGDVCLILGSFWDEGGNVELLREFKQRNALVGIYFHDLIPVTHREYVIPQLSSEFSQALIEALSFVDFGLSNSEYAAKEVATFLKTNELRSFPITPVPLAHAFKQLKVSAHDSGNQWSEIISELDGKEFVLCVGTIEVRKNHQYLFNAWKALLGEGLQPPILVLVGRQGWGVSDLLAQIRATFYLDGQIRIFHDLLDDELVTLYRNCLFTVFPSVVEGWGLPIGESLSYGKVCVASNTTSMPEVGGELVDYIDPWDLRSGIDVLRRLIAKPKERMERETEIRRHFEPRNWEVVGANLIASVTQFREQCPKSTRLFRPLLKSGQLFLPINFTLGQNLSGHTAKLRQMYLILAKGWRPAEDFGTWMRGSIAHLSFQSDVTPANDVIIYLNLAFALVKTGDILEIKVTNGLPVLTVIPHAVSRMTIRIKAKIDKDGGVDLAMKIRDQVLASESESGSDGTRVGLLSLAYAALDDHASRADILEASLLASRTETI